jgi:hypothetical protein
VGSSRPDGGVEGNVIGFAVGRAGLDVAPPLALGAGAAAASALPPGEFVDRGIEAFSDLELFPDPGLLAAFPPPFVGMGKGVLP